MLGTLKWKLKFFLKGEESGEMHTKLFDTEEELEEFIESTGCEVFDEEEVPASLPEDLKVYVNVYRVTRHYGGPEEGGWWYNHFECVECVPVRNKNATTLRQDLEIEYADMKQGDIYSVLGGTEVDVRIERTRCESETRERPFYE